MEQLGILQQRLAAATTALEEPRPHSAPLLDGEGKENKAGIEAFTLDNEEYLTQQEYFLELTREAEEGNIGAALKWLVEAKNNENEGYLLESIAIVADETGGEAEFSWLRKIAQYGKKSGVSEIAARYYDCCCRVINNPQSLEVKVETVHAAVIDPDLGDVSSSETATAEEDKVKKGTKRKR